MNETSINTQNKKSSSCFFKFIDNHGIWIVYLIAFLSIIFSASLKEEHWIMIIPIGVFLFYDIWFRWFRGINEDWQDHGRDKKETLESIRMASQYTSFFIAIIAVSLSIVLEKDISIEFTRTFDNPFIKIYGLIVLALSGVVLLFIPIPYRTKKGGEEPSDALKNCFFCVLLMEKIIILLLVYLIIVFTKAGLA